MPQGVKPILGMDAGFLPGCISASEAHGDGRDVNGPPAESAGRINGDARGVKSILYGLTLLFTCGSAFGHVKWFVDEHHHNLSTQSNTFEFTEASVLTWMSLIGGGIACAMLLDGRLGRWNLRARVCRLGISQWRAIFRIVEILVGVPLLLSAAKGSIIAPNLVASGTLGFVLRGVEATVGCMMIFNIFTPLASLLLMVLAVGVFGLFGPIAALENSGVLGLAVFLRCSSKYQMKYTPYEREWKLLVLRVLIGVSFTTLAFTEKLLNPDLALSFLQHYDLNFMKALGFDYSDRLFVLSCGCTEIVFGVIFILGFVTRINAIALLFFLVLSNSYFFAKGNYAAALTEATGHAPIIATLLILIVYGRGLSYRRLIAKHIHLKWLFLTLSGYRKHPQRSLTTAQFASE